MTQVGCGYNEININSINDPFGSVNTYNPLLRQIFPIHCISILLKILILIISDYILNYLYSWYCSLLRIYTYSSTHLYCHRKVLSLRPHQIIICSLTIVAFSWQYLCNKRSYTLFSRHYTYYVNRTTETIRVTLMYLRWTGSHCFYRSFGPFTFPPDSCINSFIFCS